jgi:hypothetical protein
MLDDRLGQDSPPGEVAERELSDFYLVDLVGELAGARADLIRDRDQRIEAV